MCVRNLNRRIRRLILLSTIALSGCYPGLQRQQPQTEAIILWDSTVIPCRILEITEAEIFFEPLSTTQSFNYGDRISIGQVWKLRIIEEGKPLFVTVPEFLAMVGGEPGASEPEPPAEGVAVQEEEGRVAVAAEQEVATRQDTVPATPVAEATPSGPGLRLRHSLLDSLPREFKKTVLGLHLPPPPEPPSLQPEATFEEIADLIVSGGAAGLVLYRAETLQRENARLTRNQQRLIDAIRASARWRERKQGIMRAHRFASGKFREHFAFRATEIAEKLKFTPRGETDAFIQFMIYLHTHGDLSSQRQRRWMQEWFGEESAAAFRDLLANFNDWYYLAVARDE